MKQTQSPLALSPADRERIAEVDRLAHQGDVAVDALVSRLTDRSWAVRRSVVAALARTGDAAVKPLAKVLCGPRTDETLLAAAVDALSASRGGAAAAAMLDLIGSDAVSPALCDAAQVLGRRRAVEAIPALEKLTGHPDDNLAVAAIEALGRIGGSAGIDGLIRVLRSRNFFRVFPAIDVLGRSGDPRVLEPLLDLLDDPKYAVEVARALGRTGAPAAAAPLARRLRRANDALTRAIAVALSAIHERALEMFGTGEPVERALQDGEDPLPAIQRLAESVPGATAEEQGALCAVLAWTREAAAATTLINLLDATPAAATQALRALGRESDPQLLQALGEGDSARRALLLPLVGTRTRSAAGILPCLSDPDPAVRILACNALARIGDVAAVPRLFELLRDPDPLLSQAAVGAIQSLGSEATERLALAAAQSAEPHVRRSALRIIASFGYPAGLDALVQVVEGPDDRLRDVAIHGLALMGEPRATEVLLRTARDPNPRARAAAMRALGQAAAEPGITSILCTGLLDADPWVRYYACQSLGKLGVSSAVDSILGLVTDRAGQVRVAAVEALSRLGSPRALGALRTAAKSSDPDVQRAALLGLGARKLPEALPSLLEAIASPDPATRLIAVSAVAPYPDPSALEALVAAAGDSDPSVRDAAIGFLKGREEEAAARALIGLLEVPLAHDRAVEALATPDPRRIATLASALENAGAALAVSLVAALVRMKRPDALAAIIDALGSPNVFARRAAAAALAALRAAEARAALERAVDSDPDPEVRRAGLSGLGP